MLAIAHSEDPKATIAPWRLHDLRRVAVTNMTTASAATVNTSAWYVLVNRNSGKALDVNGASTADGANLIQWTRTNTTNQQFQFVDSGGGYYRLRARHSGKDGQRYKPAPERVFGTSLLRLLMRLRLGQPISDGTSGLYAVNRNALALLADPYVCEAPEVEALVRITDAKLRLIEVPVHMRQREHGESSFRGKRAVELVVTIGLTLFAGELMRRRHQRKQKTGLAKYLPSRG